MRHSKMPDHNSAFDIWNMYIYSQEEYIFVVLITLSKEKDETWNNEKEFGLFLIFLYTVQKGWAST